MSKEFMDDGLLIKGVTDAVKENIERTLAETNVLSRIFKALGGKKMFYNMLLIRNLGGMIDFYEQLYNTCPDIIADLPTDDLLNSFRKSIDVIEKTFKEKDKELEVYE